MVINTPSNYSSMWEELTYTYSNETAEDVVVQIIDSRSSEVIGVKKLYSCDNFSLDIAPLIFDSMLPQPRVVSNTLLDVVSSSGFPKIALKVGSTTTAASGFTYATEQVEAPSVLTTMPQQRMLYAGEFDSIWVTSTEGLMGTFTVKGYSSDDGSLKVSEGYSCGSSDLGAILHLCADAYNSTCDSLIVSYLEGGEAVKTINYTLLPEPSSGYRLAWISSSGSIESYTFPIVSDISRSSSGKLCKTLRSAYGSREEIEALSEITNSLVTWRVDEDGYTQISVEPSEQPIIQDGALAIITLKIEQDD